MAVDILNLGFKVDTAQVKTASKDLDNLSKSAKSSGASINKMGADAQQSSKGMATLATSVRGLVGVYAGLASVKALIGIADDYTKLTAQLKLATRSQDEFNSAFTNVQNISKSAQSGLSETAMLYARISNATRDLGANQTTVAAITQSVALGLKVSGATAAEASSAMLQLSQAFGSGILRGEEFNAVNEAAPRLMKALADGMGVPIGQLRSLASEGKITSDILGNALVKSLADLKKEAEQTQTVGGAFVGLKNNILLTAGSLDQATGASKAFASAIKAISDSGAIRIIFETIAVLGLNVAFVFKTIANEIVGFGKQLQALSNLDFKGAIAIGDQVGKDAAIARVELDKLIESILNPAITNSALKEEIVTLTKATGTLTAEEKERAKQVKNHQESILKSIAIIQMENDLIKQGVPLQDAKTIAQMKANDATDKMIVSTLNAISENEKLTESYKANIDAVMNNAKAYSDLIIGLEQSIQAQKDENDVTRGLAKSVEDLAIARLEEYKVKVASLGYGTADLEREIELRKQLSSEMEYKKVLDAEKKASEEKVKEAEKAADDLKKINDKVAEDFNKSLTDAIFRGFESGKSFAKTFKDSLINSFKTLILRPIVSFIVDSSGIAKVMGAITGGVSGTANASGVDGIGSAASSAWQGITQGFETANIAFEQSIQQFGSWIANFSDGTGALADIGGAIGEYSGAISQALPYAGSVIKLLQGDFLSAGFTAAGTAIGTALGGPIGGMVGSFLGSAIGGLFGGAKTYRSQVTSSYSNGQFTSNKATGAGSRLLKGAEQPLTELSQAFATTLSGLFKAANLDVDMELSTQIGKKKRSWASFTATIGDEVFKTVVGANKGGLEKTLETLVNQTFSDVMIKAIQASDLQTGIKNLFTDLTDKDQIAQMSAAAQSLMQEFGSMAGQIAQIAVDVTDSTESLLEFINAIDDVKTNVDDVMFSLLTPVEQASKMLTELGTIFGSLNLTVPTSVADLQALAKSIDYTTESGLKLAAALPQLVAVYNAAQQAAEQVVANAKANTANARQALIEAFNIERDRLQNIVDNVKESENALRDAFNSKALGIQDTITKFKNFGDSIRAFRLSLGERVAGGGSPLLAARTRFDTVSALALSGNEEALGSIQDASTGYLDAFEQYSGSFVEYQRAFANVSETLLAVENSSFSTASVAQLQLDSLKTQVGKLISIDDTAKTVEVLMGEFKTAQALSASAQVQLTSLNSQQISILGSIDGGIVNLATALASYQSAISAELSAVSALNTAKANAAAAATAATTDTSANVVKTSIASLSSGALTNILNKELGSTAATQEAFKEIRAAGDRVTVSTVQDYIRTNFGDKYFAQGGVFTNGIVDSPTAFNIGTMGEKGAEAIMPLTNINGSLGVSTNNSEMVKQLTIISEKMSRLESAQIATVQNTGKVARIVERADNGDSLNVTVVT